MKITDGFVFETRTGLLWHPDTLELEWMDGKVHSQECKDLGLVWRLPEIWELLSIVDFDMSEPATELPGMKNDIYWTAQKFSASKGAAWVVNFRYGSMYIYNSLYKNLVRLVSGVYKDKEELEGMIK
jgi:hypothetical protein